jgi:hypothetical protein
MPTNQREGSTMEQTERPEPFRALPGGGTGGISITPVPPRSPASPRPTRQALERLAVDAHARGMTWADFWPPVAADVGALEPWDRQRYRRLVARLTALVAAGNLDGAIPPQDGYGRPMDWELDDLATAATAALVRSGMTSSESRRRLPILRQRPTDLLHTPPVCGDLLPTPPFQVLPRPLPW